MRGSPEAEGTTSLPTPLDGELTVSPLTGDRGWRVASEITPPRTETGSRCWTDSFGAMRRSVIWTCPQ